MFGLMLTGMLAFAQVSEEDIQEAERVAQETRQAMRNILKGIILILPAMPFPQPPQGYATHIRLSALAIGVVDFTRLSSPKK